MVINELNLVNFRNYSKKSFNFNKTTSVIGKNGHGKTNLLEAIRYLSVLKSFRAKKERELLTFGADTTRIVGKGVVGERDMVIEVGLSNERKQVVINGSKKRVTEGVGVFKTVLFAPDDLDFITGSPSYRRRFLDMIISQTTSSYLLNLLTLQKVIRQRNVTLQQLGYGSVHTDALAIWDDKLIETAQAIQPLRQGLVEKLNNGLSQRYQIISGQKKDVLEVSYQESITTKEALQQSFSRDSRYKQSTVGPHHDDMSVLLNGQPIGLFGSRGERRSAALSLKQAEVEVLTINEPPILLLDDMLSELDHERQIRLLDLLNDHQTVITATELSPELKKASQSVIELD